MVLMIKPAAVVCAAALALAGCGKAPPIDGEEPGAVTPRIEVLAAFYPYWWVAQRVGGQTAAVELLTEPGVEPHDLELSPRKVAEVGEADLVIYQEGFQPAVDEVVKQQPVDKRLEVNAVLGRTPTPDEHATESPTAPAADGEHSSGDGHDHGSDPTLDPHIWLDTDKLSAVVTATADAMSRIDPEGSAGYQQRAASVRADLAALDGEFRDGLAECARRTVVVNHAAFGHLTTRYGLTQVAINGITPDAAPSPQRLAELAEQIRREGATTVFTETLANPRLAETLASEARVRTATLNPLEGLAGDDDRDFISVMNDNLNALRAGLDCRGSSFDTAEPIEPTDEPFPIESPTPSAVATTEPTPEPTFSPSPSASALTG
jgi:zinc transport system substrate-binding protein